MKTSVYVDGFNLYYGAVKNTPYKWLDLNKLCRLLLPNHQIQKIKYFTALVKPRPNDLLIPIRQQTYLRALKTLPNIEIIFGHFLTQEISMPLVNSLPNGQRYAKVIKTEEKGSDVNIATHLLSDGYSGRYKAAVLITNDSDLLEAVRIVRTELNLSVGIINPHKRPSRVLLKYASFIKQIRKGVLANSQFADILQDANGAFQKPKSW